ncbi:MAG: UDP-4-amino-4,6-dideoxy-N-acetyl-beta-L-altrosamine transaminase [Steroidobacteraceae bacterium]
MTYKPSRLLTYGRQCLDDDDRRAVLEVLESDYLTQGPYVERFEQALAQRFDSPHVKVCTNGTAALHLAALALGWGPGDVVIVPAITFVASANCAVYVGAEPYFVDIDPVTLCIDPEEVERAVLRLRAANRRVRAVVAVDMAGHPADWVALRALADRFDLQLVDDACHALGASYAKGSRHIGDGVHADVTTLSFHPVKHITTGEGGAVLTRDAQIADKVALLRSHGIRRDREQIADWDGPWHLEMTDLGYNFRLTDIQCALGLSQLRKLDRFVARRRAIAALYDTLLPEVGSLRSPVTSPDVQHSYHLYVVRAPFRSVADRRVLFAAAAERGIQLQVHYRPVPLNGYYVARCEPDVMKRLPRAADYYRECFSIPVFPQLENDEVRYVVDVLRELCEFRSVADA